MRSLLRLGEFDGESLSRRLVTPTFRIKTDCTHLIFHFSEYLVGRSRGFGTIKVDMHTFELFSEVFLNRLDQVMQI